MKVPACVLWQLTKNWNSYLVKQKKNQFSHDPLNLTGLHNASSAGKFLVFKISGLCRDQAIGLSAAKTVSKKKKQFKREFTLIQKHKTHNKVLRKKNSMSKGLYSVNPLRREVNGAANSIKKMSGVTARD